MTTQKNILITGSSRGIGFLTAKELLRRGHRVTATMRDPNGRNSDPSRELVEFANEWNGDLKIAELDVTDDKSVANVIQEIDRGDPIDVLLNNVGVMPVGVTEAFTPTQLQEMFDVNFLSIARTIRATLPHMRARKSGLIISMSSSAGRVAIPYFGVYCATKWAMEAYCESLNYELEGSGVRSILVEPSAHKTDLVGTSPMPVDQECVSSYGPIAEGGDRILNMFEVTFAENNPINNAQNVADKLAELIDMKEPPLRTAVGADMGVQSINDAAQPFQGALIQSLKSVYAA